MNKNKKGLLILTIILSVLVVALSSYLIYDKVINKDNDELNDNKNNIVENNQENDNVTNENNDEIDSTTLNLEMLDIDKLSEYKNHDETYGNIKSVSFRGINESYSINLTIDGKIYIHNNDANEKNKQIEVDNVIDIVSFSNDAGSFGAYYCYILTNSGDVYYYKLDKVLENDYSVVKVEEVSSVKKLLEISWGPVKDAGGAWALIAITSNNEYIELGKGSI